MFYEVIFDNKPIKNSKMVTIIRNMYTSHSLIFSRKKKWPPNKNRNMVTFISNMYTKVLLFPFYLCNQMDSITFERISISIKIYGYE